MHSNIERYRLHIEDGSIENLRKELIDLATLADGLRHYQKKWKDEYGAPNRRNMATWEKRMDEWIESHKQPIE